MSRAAATTSRRLFCYWQVLPLRQITAAATIRSSRAQQYTTTRRKGTFLRLGTVPYCGKRGLATEEALAKGPESGPLKEYNVRVATGQLRNDLYQRGTGFGPLVVELTD